ncbi:MAG TPA: pitrilysin family protein [Chthonomonadaceae bacterium]|nr:pitrilysin family protein [Chthonomonadaceae bacterium]
MLLVMLKLDAAAQTIHLPPVTRTRLANGIRVIVMEYHRAPTVTVRIVFTGGERLDPEGKTGATALMVDLLKRGTETRSATQIAEAIDYLGGSVDTGADDERCTAGLDLLVKNTDDGLDLLAEILRHPTFPAAELERERALELASLQTIGDDPGRVAGYVLTKAMYAGHPYGREATQATTQAINRDDILAVYHAGISPDRMTIVAVGDFRSADMTARLQAKFGDWTAAGAAPPPTPPVPPVPVRRILVDKPDATQTQVRLARTAFARNSPDYFPSELADTILGGGFTSRLVDEVRVNRSLTYGIGSSFSALKAGGLFTVDSFTKIETTRALLDATRGVMARTAQQGVTEAEYHKAQGYLAGQFAIQLQTPEALAGELSSMAFYGLPDNYVETYLPRLRAVALPDVNRIAKRYFEPNGLSTILVGPASKISGQLKGAGEFEVRPVTDVAK